MAGWAKTAENGSDKGEESRKFRKWSDKSAGTKSNGAGEATEHYNAYQNRVIKFTSKFSA